MNIFKKIYVAIQEGGVELPPSADRCLIERGVAAVRALIAENERIEEARRLEFGVVMGLLLGALGFFLGLFLGWIGLIAVCCFPSRKDRKPEGGK